MLRIETGAAAAFAYLPLRETGCRSGRDGGAELAVSLALLSSRRPHSYASTL